MFLFHFLFFIEYEENKKVSKKAAVSLPLPFCHTNEIFIKTASHTNAHKSRPSRAVPYVCLPPQFHSPSAPESALHSGLWTAGAQSRRLSCLSPEVPKISGRLFRFRCRALRLPRRKSLFLATGKFYAALADIGVVAVRQLHDKFMCIGRFRCADDLLVGRIRSAIADVVDDRSRKQIHILLHNTDLIALPTSAT